MDRFKNGQDEGDRIVRRIFNPSNTSGIPPSEVTAEHTRQIHVKTNNAGKITGKIDIVCHSMGYAHMLGIIDKLIENIPAGATLGNLYIFAPEIPNGPMSLDYSRHENVFQYGSQEAGDQQWKRWRTDGVASQGPIMGITNNNRRYIPRGQTTEDGKSSMESFDAAHSIKNFKWIFDYHLDDVKSR